MPASSTPRSAVQPRHRNLGIRAARIQPQVLRSGASTQSRSKMTAMSLYKDAVQAGIPIDHHESDLYILDTPAARSLIAKHKLKGKRFTSRLDGLRWLDVPFAYEPFW